LSECKVLIYAFAQIKFFLQGIGKSGEGKAETGKGAGKIPRERSKVRNTSRVWKEKNAL
jgi:hypothetical protein